MAPESNLAIMGEIDDVIELMLLVEATGVVKTILFILGNSSFKKILSHFRNPVSPVCHPVPKHL